VCPNLAYHVTFPLSPSHGQTHAHAHAHAHAHTHVYEGTRTLAHTLTQRVGGKEAGVVT